MIGLVQRFDSWIQCDTSVRVALLTHFFINQPQHNTYMLKTKHGGLRFQVQQSVDGFELVAR
ncbi:hypothetical protein B7453_29715 [Pseudomonas sp. IB20]|nr:hypothetical protein B7453_29715 [Pseudomonas sp. IB20]